MAPAMSRRSRDTRIPSPVLSAVTASNDPSPDPSVEAPEPEGLSNIPIFMTPLKHGTTSSSMSLRHRRPLDFTMDGAKGRTRRFLRRNLGRVVDRDHPEVMYELLFIDEASEQHRVVHTRTDGKCPFCSFSLGSWEKVLKHLNRFHQDHHFCSAKPGEDGTIIITAKPRESKYQRPKRITGRGDFRCFLRCRGGKARKTLRCRVLPLTEHSKSPTEGSALSTPAIPFQPTRQYYHSKFRQPLSNGDWAVDSDDESSDEWLDDLAAAGLNEFTDVMPDEKRYLNLWKRFVRGDSVLSDKDVPAKCFAFIHAFVDDLRGLRRELVKHMTMMWEKRLISQGQLLECFTLYDRVQAGEDAVVEGVEPMDATSAVTTTEAESSVVPVEATSSNSPS